MPALGKAVARMFLAQIGDLLPPVAEAIGAFAILGGGVWKAASWYGHVNERLDNLDQHLEQIESKIDELKR
jgi:hypothetical protein